MRDMQPVSPEEFQAFIEANASHLQQKVVDGAQCYVDTSSADGWPDNLVASFLPANEKRRRAGGWRIAVPDEPN